MLRLAGFLDSLRDYVNGALHRARIDAGAGCGTTFTVSIALILSIYQI